MGFLQAKSFEIRDFGTFIPVVAIPMYHESAYDSYLMRRAGFISGPTVLIVRLETGESATSANDWRNSTLHTAHKFIEKNFSKLVNGEVIDVEFITGKTSTPKQSERYDKYGEL